MNRVTTSTPVDPAFDAAPITPSAGNLVDQIADGGDGLPYVARALWCETAGLVTFKSQAGNVRTGFPLTAGPNPVGASQVTAFTGTNLWGVKP
jgi:hypothetical protein